MNDLVSIIIPAYKAEDTIERCIESLLKQSYKDIEMVVVDDGSPDQTGNLCDQIAKRDNRIKVFHKINGGVSNARNFGFHHAKGKFILCVDSDDYVDADYVMEFMEAKKKYPNVSNVWCGLYVIDQNEKQGTSFVVSSAKTYTLHDKKDILYLTQKLYGLAPFNKLYERDKIINNNLYMDETMSLGEDALFNYSYLDLKDNSSILVINKPLYIYVRKDNGSLDTKYYPNLFELYKMHFEVIYEYLTKWKVSQENLKDFYNARFFAFEKSLRNNMRDESKKSIKSRIAENTKIMRSKEFSEAFNSFCGNIHPLYRWAYAQKSFSLILMCDFFADFKKKLFGVI